MGEGEEGDDEEVGGKGGEEEGGGSGWFSESIGSQLRMNTTSMSSG